jgi:peptidoglycan/LPS O-acetylase OafA/YrhL
MKAHYQVLDGLRGTAALAVIVFHIFELITPDWAHNPLPHGYLAVDFFYALSGFVLGYAYDDRLAAHAPAKLKLGFLGFVKRRLIRLHPMVPVAVTGGLVCYLCDPNVGETQTLGAGLAFGAVALAYGLNLFLLPSPTLPNHWDETHSLDAPSWTLFWEYIANVFFVLWLHKIRRGLHVALLIISGAALIATAACYKNSLGWGWGYDTLWVAPVRLAFPFLAGLLVYRAGWKIRVPQPYLVASLLVLAVLAMPSIGTVDMNPSAAAVAGHLNGLYEALAIIFVFPLALMIGASIDEVKGPTGPACRFTGALSYPLYITHYPFVFLFGHWVWATHPADGPKFAVAAGLFVFLIVYASAFTIFYDQPVRAWLKRKYLVS